LLSAGGFYENNPPYGIALNTVEMFKDSVCEYGVVGIMSHEARDVDFRVYPNPSSGLFHLEVSGENHETPFTANIYNLQGQLVFTQMLEPGNPVMNVKLFNGVYLLTVILNNEMHFKLITIQN